MGNKYKWKWSIRLNFEVISTEDEFWNDGIENNDFYEEIHNQGENNNDISKINSKINGENKIFWVQAKNKIRIAIYIIG